MSKQRIKIFTVAALLAFVFRLAGLVSGFYFPGYRAAIFIDVIGEMLFLSLFFFIAKDLEQNYGKGVRPVYLFVFSSLIITCLNVVNFLSGSMMMFVRLLFLAVIAVFIFYLLKTAYRLFAIAYIISIMLMFAFQFLVNKLWQTNTYKYWIFLSAVPVLYPLVLIYIVRTKNNDTMQDEINSIGSDMEG